MKSERKREERSYSALYLFLVFQFYISICLCPGDAAAAGMEVNKLNGRKKGGGRWKERERKLNCLPPCDISQNVEYFIPFDSWVRNKGSSSSSPSLSLWLHVSGGNGGCTVQNTMNNTRSYMSESWTELRRTPLPFWSFHLLRISCTCVHSTLQSVHTRVIKFNHFVFYVL